MKNTENDEIQDLITQLKQLQLQQTALLARLDEARCRETGADVKETRGLVIGDKVRIKNPRPFQADRGTVIKIRPNRTTVRTRSGNKILRASKNLTIDHE
jgi:transcription antitermination factor NusG